ncbi:MAG: cyclodeaminase/cyclohydrolase family protein [Planctomycetes bacterium]|nr:cyclodeaminase/cyclohydrolase family protein [Planctomycetota bacterium]
MEDFTRLSVERFLNQLADRVPTPGGGSVAALTGSLACAMARMVAGYSVKKKTEESVRNRIEEVSDKLRRADELLRALVTQDAEVYETMMAASRAARDDPSLESRHQQAIVRAIAVPMEVAALASNTLDILDEFLPLANPYLISDGGVAAVLAEAAVRASAFSVRVNTSALVDEPTRSRIEAEIGEITKRAARTSGSIEATVKDRLKTSTD